VSPVHQRFDNCVIAIMKCLAIHRFHLADECLLNERVPSVSPVPRRFDDCVFAMMYCNGFVFVEVHCVSV
jgi:hypothetical protein